jgi:hypothetical protein
MGYGMVVVVVVVAVAVQSTGCVLAVSEKYEAPTGNHPPADRGGGDGGGLPSVYPVPVQYQAAGSSPGSSSSVVGRMPLCVVTGTAV